MTLNKDFEIVYLTRDLQSAHPKTTVSSDLFLWHQPLESSAWIGATAISLFFGNGVFPLLGYCTICVVELEGDVPDHFCGDLDIMYGGRS